MAELTRIIESMEAAPVSRLAGELRHLQLTERLSSAMLEKLSAAIKGKKSRSALTVLGDASSFLDPAPNEIPRKPGPGIAEQKMMLEHVDEYLSRTIPKLPDFFARRWTTSFQDVSTSTNSTRRREMHLVARRTAMVYYRDGKEVVREKGGGADQLVTQGIFGPILAIVISDAARSARLEWCRWEDGPNGIMAVFRFQVPQSESHYEVSGVGDFGFRLSTAYHGEIGVDPRSGAILRLVLKADPGLGSSMTRADVMVEYGWVTIGGRPYICPLKSVSYFMGVLRTPLAFGSKSAQPTEQLNDVIFSDYHVFRAEMRILP